jgi:hypothetical protein
MYLTVIVNGLIFSWFIEPIGLKVLGYMKIHRSQDYFWKNRYLMKKTVFHYTKGDHRYWYWKCVLLRCCKM